MVTKKFKHGFDSSAIKTGNGELFDDSVRRDHTRLVCLRRQASDTSIRVAGRLKHFLKNLQATCDSSQLNYLKRCYSESDCPYIDYDQFGKAFTQFYFWKNYIKALHVFLSEPPSLTAVNVTDVGCGSAAITCAYLTLLDQLLIGHRQVINVTLIDRSREQLQFGRALLENVSPEFENLEIRINTRCEDLLHWNPEQGASDIVFLGHVLSENKSIVDVLLEKAFVAGSGGANVYVIERMHEPIWPTIEAAVGRLTLPYVNGEISCDVSQFDSGYEGSKRRADVEARYLLLSIPKEKHLVDLIRSYFRAWETKSPATLDSVFAPHAEYYEKPQEPPVRGLDQIKAYWQENVMQQRNINLTILRTAYTSTNIFAEWDAEFDRTHDHTHLRGTLILDVDRRLNLVTRLDEYYNSTHTQLK